MVALSLMTACDCIDEPGTHTRSHSSPAPVLGVPCFSVLSCSEAKAFSGVVLSVAAEAGTGCSLGYCRGSFRPGGGLASLEPGETGTPSRIMPG